MLTVRSSSSNVRPTESTGSTAISRIAYVRIVQMKSGMRIQLMPAVRMLMIVTTKLIAPSSDAIERMWRPRIQ